MADNADLTALHAPGRAHGERVHRPIDPARRAVALQQIKAAENHCRGRDPEQELREQRSQSDHACQQQRARRCKQSLRHRLQEHVGEHARERHGDRDAPESQQSRACQAAADARHRQQHVDRLADPAHERKDGVGHLDELRER
jgi:hypothetical protein